MQWVTWQDVGADRMACAWQIRRFVDPDTTFRFITPETSPLPEDAETFDVPGARLAPRRGHSTFRTMRREYRLDDPVLEWGAGSLSSGRSG